MYNFVLYYLILYDMINNVIICYYIILYCNVWLNIVLYSMINILLFDSVILNKIIYIFNIMVVLLKGFFSNFWLLYL